MRWQRLTRKWSISPSRNSERVSAGFQRPYAVESMAERVGFEPTLPFRVNTLSKRAPSATRPSLPRQNLLQPATPWEANAGVSQSAAKCTANRVPFDSMVRAAETARHRLGNSLPECHPEPSRPDGRQYFSRNSWQACKSDAEVVRRAITDPFVGAFVPRLSMVPVLAARFLVAVR
jgi:hypothetical protein